MIDSSVAGTGGNVSNAVKEVLPTITRSIADIVRVNPLFNSQGSGAGDGASVVSVAGRSFRYNALQIDGAANNDLFGLAGSAGAPGGAAETQPISLDAIQEIQLVVSPYDVRQGGFAGGGINAITKSGSNALPRHRVLLRPQPGLGRRGRRRSRDFGVQGQAGRRQPRRAAGPEQGVLLRHRGLRAQAAADGLLGRTPPASSSGTRRDVNRFLSILQNRYGYSPGPDPLARVRQGHRQRQVLRPHRLQPGPQPSADGPAQLHQRAERHRFPEPDDLAVRRTAFYRFNSKTNSTVGQLNSTFGKGVNELRLTYTRVRDHREPGVRAAAVPGGHGRAHRLDHGALPAPRTSRGATSSTRTSSSSTTPTRCSRVSTRSRSAPTTSSSRCSNLFIRDAFGSYRFNSIDLFEQGLAQQYDRSFSATSDPMQSAQFKVNQWGFYVGDQWYVRPRVTLTYGLRIDAPPYPDKPNANPVARVELRLCHRRGAERRPVVAARRLQLDAERRRTRSRSAAVSGSSPAARPTSGSRTSSATPASTSRASAPGTTPTTASRSSPIRSTSRRP